MYGTIIFIFFALISFFFQRFFPCNFDAKMFALVARPKAKRKRVRLEVRHLFFFFGGTELTINETERSEIR